jgi:hypothetical protein
MARIKLSEEGLRIVERNRQRKQWAKTERAWYELAFVSKSTLKRFLNRERITQELFVKICEVIGISNWEEVAENYLDQIDEDFGDHTTWCLVLSAQITEINRSKVLALCEHLKDFLEEPKLTLKEVKDGSVVLVLSGSQDGFEWMYYLFKSGEVTELLGLQILDVRLATVNLTQLLQNNFAEALQAGWQTLAEIFTTATASPAFRFLGNEISENSADDLIQVLRTSTDDRSLWKAADSLFQIDSSNPHAGLRMAKLIELDNQTFTLSIGILPKANERIAVRAQVYSQNDQTHLPLHLKMIVLDEQDAIIKEIQPQSGAISIQWRFSGQIRDKFSVEIALNEVSITEDFVI